MPDTTSRPTTSAALSDMLLGLAHDCYTGGMSSADIFKGFERAVSVLSTGESTKRSALDMARAIHYPECWDTAAYPTLQDAMREVVNHAQCSVCAPAAEQAEPVEMSPDFTDTARAALLWVLWHHQGGSSPVGQPIRYALGMGAHEHLNAEQVRAAKRWAAITGSLTSEFHAQPAREPMTDEQRAEVFRAAESRMVYDGNLSWRNAIVEGVEAHHGITAPAGGEGQA